MAFTLINPGSLPEPDAPTATSLSAASAPSAPEAGSVSAGSAPSAPTAGSVPPTPAPSVPTAGSVSAPSIPATPSPRAITGQLPESWGAEDYFAGGSVRLLLDDPEAWEAVTASSVATSAGRVTLVFSETGSMSEDAETGDLTEVQTVDGTRYEAHIVAINDDSVSLEGWQLAPKGADAGSVSIPSIPDTPTPANVGGANAPSAPTAATVSAGSTPAAPTPVVITGEQSPASAQAVASDSLVFLAHTETLDNENHYYVKVGSRASPVTIEFPETPGQNQRVIVADSSGQAATHAITVDAGDNTIDGASTHLIDANFSTFEYRWDGEQWKIE